MIHNIDPILDKIMHAASNGIKAVNINEHITPKVRTQLKQKGYQIFESGGFYTIKW